MKGHSESKKNDWEESFLTGQKDSDGQNIGRIKEVVKSHDDSYF